MSEAFFSREVLQAMTLPELLEIEVSLELQVRDRQDEEFFSSASEEKITSLFYMFLAVFAMFGFYFVVMSLNLAPEGTSSALVMLGSSFVFGAIVFGVASRLLQERLHRTIRLFIRHREYFVYAVLFALFILNSQSRTRAQAALKSRVTSTEQWLLVMQPSRSGGPPLPGVFRRDQAEGACAEMGAKLASVSEIEALKSAKADEFSAHIQSAYKDRGIWVLDLAKDHPETATIYRFKEPLTVMVARSTQTRYGAVCIKP